jgi:hypothetical protein
MNVITIALNGLQMILKQREAVFWIFVGPLLFVAFFGLLMKPQPRRPLAVDIVNRDRTDGVARELAAALMRDNVVVTPVEAISTDRLALVVPAGADEAVAQGKNPKLTLHAGAEETSAERDLRFKVMKASVSLSIHIAENGTPGPLSVDTVDTGIKVRDVTAGFQRTVPSYMVMFVFLNLLVSGVGIAEERRRGLLRRLGMAPVSKREIVLGKLLARVLVGWIQIAWMLLVGRMIFHVQWAEHGFLDLLRLHRHLHNARQWEDDVDAWWKRRRGHVAEEVLHADVACRYRPERSGRDEHNRGGEKGDDDHAQPAEPAAGRQIDQSFRMNGILQTLSVRTRPVLMFVALLVHLGSRRHQYGSCHVTP